MPRAFGGQLGHRFTQSILQMTNEMQRKYITKSNEDLFNDKYLSLSHFHRIRAHDSSGCDEPVGMAHENVA